MFLFSCFNVPKRPGVTVMPMYSNKNRIDSISLLEIMDPSNEQYNAQI